VLATAAAGIRYKGAPTWLLAVMDKGTPSPASSQVEMPVRAGRMVRAKLGPGKAPRWWSIPAMPTLSRQDQGSDDADASIASKAVGCSANEVFLASTA